MKLLVKFEEARVRSAAARDELLRLRLQAMGEQRRLLDRNILKWVFYSRECQIHYVQLECESLEEADSHLKASPLFPFSTAAVIPVVNSDAIVLEISRALGVASEAQTSLVVPVREVRPDGEYWLVRKELPPLNPLSTDQEQSDTLRRTIESKERVNPRIEFADLNAVGRMVGYLIGEGTRGEIHAYLSSCPLYPDLTCVFERLLTLEQAQTLTEEALALRIACKCVAHEPWLCGTLVSNKGFGSPL